MRKKNLVPTSRLNLKLPQTVRDRLEELREESEAETLAEVIRRSLAVYDTLLRETQDGKEILVRDTKGNLTRVILT